MPNPIPRVPDSTHGLAASNAKNCSGGPPKRKSADDFRFFERRKKDNLNSFKKAWFVHAAPQTQKIRKIRNRFFKENLQIRRRGHEKSEGSLGIKGFLQVFKSSGGIRELSEFVFLMIFWRVFQSLCQAIFLSENRSAQHAQTRLREHRKTTFFEAHVSEKSAKIDWLFNENQRIFQKHQK